MFIRDVTVPSAWCMPIVRLLFSDAEPSQQDCGRAILLIKSVII